MKQEIFELIVKAREGIFELQNFLFENHREYYLAAKGVLETSIDHIASIEATIEEADEENLAAAKKDLSLILYTTSKAKSAYDAPVVQNVSETQTIEEPTEVAPLIEETEEISLIKEVPVMEESVENTEEVALTETTGEENIEFNEEELNNLLAALDSANFEAIFDEEPTADFEVTPEVTEEVIYETEAPVVEDFTETTEEVAEEVAPVFEDVVVEEPTMEEPIFENSEEIDIQALDAFLNETATDDDDAFRI